MAKLTEDQIPGGLRQIHRKLERWRSAHHGRSPLPESLWRAAGEAARKHGASRTGQLLHLEYGKLKRVMEAAQSASDTVGAPTLRTSHRPASGTGKGRLQTRAAFVELAPLTVASGDVSVIELEGARGKLRLRLPGRTAEDLAGLGRALWKGIC